MLKKHSAPYNPTTVRRSLGFAAALATVSIWASFMLITRYAVGGSFTVAELLMLRMAPAAVLLAPVMLRKGVVPRGLPLASKLLMMVGAGIGFPALMMLGLNEAPASDAGALAPGTMPFWAAVAAWAISGERPRRKRVAGLALILVGATMVSLWSIALASLDGAWRGHLLFLSAAGLWGAYTVVFRQSGLDPIHALAIGIFWPFVVLTPMLLWIGLPFDGADTADIIAMGFLQSVVMTILALVLFGYAVQRIGAAETGAIAALVPVLTMIGSIVLLDEPIGTWKVVGIILVTAGVFLASSRQRT